MKKIGFFAFMPKQDARTLLETQRSENPPPYLDKIFAYLSGAPVWIAAMGVADDVICPSKVIGPLNVHTDGIWSWTEDIIYYVRNYSFRLPDDFLSHIRQANWLPPSHVDFARLNVNDVLPT